MLCIVLMDAMLYNFSNCVTLNDLVCVHRPAAVVFVSAIN